MLLHKIIKYLLSIITLTTLNVIPSKSYGQSPCQKPASGTYTSSPVNYFITGTTIGVNPCSSSMVSTQDSIVYAGWDFDTQCNDACPSAMSLSMRLQDTSGTWHQVYSNVCSIPAGVLHTSTYGVIYRIQIILHSTNFFGCDDEIIGNGNMFIHYSPKSLPVTLLDYSAQCNSNKTELTWTTNTEINNNYFTIEKSKDAINFEEVDRIKGYGNSNSTIHYSWTDDNGSEGTTYYRLKQTDFDGTFKYLEIRTVTCEPENQISIYPNPTERFFIVALPEPNNSTFTVELIDYLGKVIHTETLIASTQVELKNSIPAGTYFVKVYNETSQLVERIIKLK